jgi:hypothetical protein
MGLFCTPKSNSGEHVLEAALGNIQLFMQEYIAKKKLDHIEKDDDPNEFPNRYLLELSICQIKDVKGKLDGNV